MTTIETEEAIAIRLREHGVTMPPTADELPYCDGETMETHRHDLQATLLKEPLDIAWADRDVFIAGNMFVYFSLEQVKHNDFRGPDVFVVLDVPRGDRKSWVVWEENGKGPDVVIELLSESTASIDQGVKKQIYQDHLRVPEYFWFDPYTGELAGFRLQDAVYQPIMPDAHGRLFSQRLGLLLVVWEGTFRHEEARWLRWATSYGTALPTGAEWGATAEQHAHDVEQRLQHMERRVQQALDEVATQQRRSAEMEALLARYREHFGEPPA